MTGERYVKLFSSITESTIWTEPAGTRLTWIAMLARANMNGEVFASIPGLARLANVSLPECETALATLLAPDPYSRTKDHEGRRIVEIDGGWLLLNFVKFDRQRNDLEAAQRRVEGKREWDRANRGSRPNAKHRKQDDEDGATPDVPPTAPDGPPTQSVHPTTTATALQDQKQLASLAAREREARADLPAGLPDEVEPERWRLFEDHHRSQRRWSVSRLKTAVGQLRQIVAHGEIDPNDVLEWATARGLADLRDAAQRMTADADWLARRARAGPTHGPPLSKTGAAFAALNLSADTLDPAHAQRHAAALVSRSDSARTLPPPDLEP